MTRPRPGLYRAAVLIAVAVTCLALRFACNTH